MGKNIVICHGGGPTAVINASLAGIITEAKNTGDVGDILIAENGIAGFLEKKFVNVSGISSSQLERLKNTPSSAIGTCRYKVKESDYSRIQEILDTMKIGYFFYNGGNDSMDTCNKIANISDRTRVIGVPKTIDNDLAVTHHCPGFGSAARYSAVTTLELGLDLKALPIHVSVIEFMGRNAGWITGSTALARKEAGDAPHLIYLPERPFIKEEFLKDVQNAFDRYGGVVVAVSEGLTDQDGAALTSHTHASAIDDFGHAIPGNNSHLLASLVTSELGIRARSEKPGLPGRASFLLSSKRDREETFACGRFAMKSAAAGITGKMAGYRVDDTIDYSVENILIPLEDVANKEKLVPQNWLNDRGNDVTGDFLNYVTPIVNEEIPDYFSLRELKGAGV